MGILAHDVDGPARFGWRRLSKVIRQAGVIPFRVVDGALRVLLITSRDTGRWVIPKGWIEAGFSAPEAALREAFEEAGIKGVIDRKPLGTYLYEKRLRSGRVRVASVTVFGLRVEKQLRKFPERQQRHAEWMAPDAAALAVEEPGLAILFGRLADVLAGAGKRKVAAA